MGAISKDPGIDLGFGDLESLGHHGLCTLKLSAGSWELNSSWMMTIHENCGMPSGTKPLPEPLLTQIYGYILSHNELIGLIIYKYAKNETMATEASNKWNTNESFHI